jgi:hypothetical protein
LVDLRDLGSLRQQATLAPASLLAQSSSVSRIIQLSAAIGCSFVRQFDSNNGIDFYFDWGATHFFSKQAFVGLVGYAYQQITDDFGQSPILGGFRSRVLGVGPEVGYIFPVGGTQGFLSLKAYGEFDASNRPSGWNTWLRFAISPASTAVTPTQHLITKQALLTSRNGASLSPRKSGAGVEMRRELGFEIKTDAGDCGRWDVSLGLEIR